MNKRLIIATRESPLALAQAEWVKNKLQALHPQIKISFLKLKTQADKILSLSLTKIGGKGLFVKELEEALYDRRADIAVHSMKDVPMHLPEGLIISVICEREDPRDVLVSHQLNTLQDLPSYAKVGSSSLRRKMQLRVQRNDLDLQDLRGNVNTRLARLDRGDFAAIVLASAGLKRLGLESRIQTYFPTNLCMPAAGQGALGIECRSSDQATLELIAPLNDQPSFLCVSAERAVCRTLGGSCTTPIAAFAQMKENTLWVQAKIVAKDAIQVIQSEARGDAKEAEALGQRVANQLIDQDAIRILDSFTE